MAAGRRVASYQASALIECDTVEQNAALCGQVGLDFVELNMNLPICQTPALSDTGRLRALAERQGIYFTLHLDETLNPADFNAAVARAYSDTVVAAISLAKRLGAPMLTMHMNPGVWFTLPDRKVYLFEKYRGLYEERLAAFRDRCERAVGDSGVLIGVENTGGFRTEAVELLLKSPAFGLTFDVGHSHAAGRVDEPFILAHEERLAHFHIHDARGTADHLPLGEGELDLPRYLGLARKRRCRCVLETKTADALKRSAAWIRNNGLT